MKNISLAQQLLVIVALLLLAIILLGAEKAKQYERDYLTKETKGQMERLFDVFHLSV